MIGGLISEHIRWGWIFLINVPIGVVTGVIATAVVAESHGNTGSRRLDLPGLAVSAAGLFALTYALIDGQDRGWTSAPILTAFAAAAVCFAGFLAIEARSAQPMVPLSMFRYREFTGGSGTMMGWSFGVLGIYFFTSVYLQSILGFSPVKAGLSFVPMALCIAVSATSAPQVVRLIGRGRTVSLGVLIMVAGLSLFALLGAHASFASLMPGFVIFGLGGGLMTVPLTEAVLAATPPERGGVASALLNESREVAGLLGITVIGAVLRSVQSGSLRSGATRSAAFLDGYHAGVYAAIGILAVCVVVSYLTLRPRQAVAEVPAPSSAREPRPVRG